MNHDKNISGNNSTYLKIPELGTWLPLVILDIFVLLCNALIILAFISAKRLRKKAANILLFNQSVADFLNGLLFVPFHVLELFNHKTRVTPFLVCYIVFASDLSLLALAVDRYLLIAKPFLHRSWIDAEMLPKYIALIWIIPLLVTLIPLCWWFEESAEAKVKATRIYLGTLWLMLTLFALALFVMYISILQHIKEFLKRQNDRRISIRTSESNDDHYRLSKQEFKVVRLFGSLLLFFSLAYLPILCINFMDLLGREDLILPEIETFSAYSYLLNSLVNPILCMIMKDDYRKIISILPVIRNLRVFGRQSFYDINHSSSMKAINGNHIVTITTPELRRANINHPHHTKKPVVFAITRHKKYTGSNMV